MIKMHIEKDTIIATVNTEEEYKKLETLLNGNTSPVEYGIKGQVKFSIIQIPVDLSNLSIDFEQDKWEGFSDNEED